MSSFIRYYKWHLIFSLIVIVCVAYICISLTTRNVPDLTIGFAGANYVNMQTFNDNKLEIEQLLHDANDDGKKTASLAVYSDDVQKNLDEAFAQIVDSESYDIYIASKETFEAYEDKSLFTDAATYTNTTNLSDKGYDMLKDSSGRVYAVSLDGNSYIKHFGVVTPDGLYIAAAASGDEELSQREKNGRNITKYIIENKELYS